MIKAVYTRSWDAMKQNFVKIWGVTLLGTLITCVVSAFGIIPIITVPITLVIFAGMEIIFLNKINGQDPVSEDLFAGFKKFWHVAGGMCWMYLWLIIWALIPVAGIVMAIIKSYSYRFTPYILMTEPDVTPTEALKKSMKMTEGYKGTMFGADILIGIGIFVLILIFTFLASLRRIGGVFFCIEMLITIAFYAFGPMFYGLIRACFYTEALNNPGRFYHAPTAGGYAPAAPVAPAAPAESAAPVENKQEPTEEKAAPEEKTGDGIVCKQCQTSNAKGSLFCSNCGSKLE